MASIESIRLQAQKDGKVNWRKWGPYLSERQWGTVREDYSANGNAWNYFPHDHARSRAYRWGEDGIAGWSDDQQQLCFAPAFWNGRDPILKERLFGLNSEEGNHGEDVKELYYYLDNTPSHSYAHYLYKYPQATFPYDDLVQTNRGRSKDEGEYELLDTGVMEDYWDIDIQYAKYNEECTYIQIAVTNRGTKTATITVLPTLWYKNIWSFSLGNKPEIIEIQNTQDGGILQATHEKLGVYYLYYQASPKTLFTENETNKERLFNSPNDSPFVKDAFHRAVIDNDFAFLENQKKGTKAAPLYTLTIAAGETQVIRLVLTNQPLEQPFIPNFDLVIAQRKSEADDFYNSIFVESKELQSIQRQAIAGLLWNKQFYQYSINRWLEGDPGQPPPPPQRKQGRNSDWPNFEVANVMSMPDNWEFPWFASWDLAFQSVAIALVDFEFAKDQLLLVTGKALQRQDGSTPAYEWKFGDVNPPVLAWAALHIFEMEQRRTRVADFYFLKEIFSSLYNNFLWWLQREDSNNNNIFSGGFLGLDNISLFDRSQILPEGEYLEQADATAWMAMYSLQMMKISMILTANKIQADNSALAIEYYNQFSAITEAINQFGNGKGLWDEEAGFFYDCLKHPNGEAISLPVKSIVGFIPLFAVSFIENDLLEKNPALRQHILSHREENKHLDKCFSVKGMHHQQGVLLSLLHQDKLERILDTMLDENAFLGQGGIRSLSKEYQNLFCPLVDGVRICINYEPGESTTNLYGGNSNWRGPVWMPINYLIVHSLKKYQKLYEPEIKKHFPGLPQNPQPLSGIKNALTGRLINIFQKDQNGNRPVHHQHPFYRRAENENLLLFYEYFHGDNARGCGASHQTGWTALIALLIQQSSIYSPPSQNL